MLFSTSMSQGSLVIGVFSRFGVSISSCWLPGTNRSLGLDGFFWLKLLLLFSDRWVKLLQAIWPHQKAQAIVGCVHVIHQRMTFGWQHGIIKQIQRSILSGVCITHTYAPCTLVISQYIEILYTHPMFYQISSSLVHHCCERWQGWQPKYPKLRWRCSPPPLRIVLGP